MINIIKTLSWKANGLSSVQSVVRTDVYDIYDTERTRLMSSKYDSSKTDSLPENLVV